MFKRCIGVAAVASSLVASGALAVGMSASPADPESANSSEPARSEFTRPTSTRSDNAAAAPARKSGKPVTCDGTLQLGNEPKTKVVVRRGDSCTVVDSTIKSLRARPGSVNVRVYNTEVTRNLMVRGATGTVHIGPKDCGYDPVVGNNVIVRNSHNVLICYTSVDNNIMVRNNDGRITIRDSTAGNNIRASRNLAYAPTAVQSRTAAAGTIRLVRNEADNHIVARDNHPSRDIIDRENNPSVRIG